MSVSPCAIYGEQNWQRIVFFDEDSVFPLIHIYSTTIRGWIMGPLEAAYLQNVSPHQKRVKQE